MKNLVIRFRLRCRITTEHKRVIQHYITNTLPNMFSKDRESNCHCADIRVGEDSRRFVACRCFERNRCKEKHYRAKLHGDHIAFFFGSFIFSFQVPGTVPDVLYIIRTRSGTCGISASRTFCFFKERFGNRRKLIFIKKPLINSNSRECKFKF